MGPLSCLSLRLVYCGQTVGLIKMPLGTKTGLGPGDVVLHGDPPLHLKREHSPHNFRPMSVVAKRSPISATAELLLTFLAEVCYSLSIHSLHIHRIASANGISFPG